MDILDVREMYNFGERTEFALFFGKSPRIFNGVDISCFSQHTPSPFVDILGMKFEHCEQYMMYKKAMTFGDVATAMIIADESDPIKCKTLGQSIANFDNSLWDEVKYGIVKQGNLYKFGQNKTMLKCLLQTNGAILVEASPYDIVWGVGLATNDHRVGNPNNWLGQNLLGFALMDVRDILNKEMGNEN